MKMFVKPSVTRAGKSEEVIKGKCGWGAENAWLDKTGASKVTRRRSVVCQHWPAAGKVVYCCRSITVCSTQSNQC